jgi:hypothetical protein
MTQELQPPPGYAALLKDIKERVRTAQLRAALAVNRDLIMLYWSIGRDISSRFDTEGWGTKVIDRLAKDLGTEFPGVEGFSPRNLRYMRSFAGLAGARDFATAYCKIAVGPPDAPSGPDQGPAYTGMVPESCSRKWMESKCPCPSYLSSLA